MSNRKVFKGGWILNIVKKKMANTKSIKKVREYLANKQEAVSLSEIVENVQLRPQSVRDVLEFLQESNKIRIMATAGTTLIQNIEVSS